MRMWSSNGYHGNVGGTWVSSVDDGGKPPNKVEKAAKRSIRQAGLVDRLRHEMEKSRADDNVR